MYNMFTGDAHHEKGGWFAHLAYCGSLLSLALQRRVCFRADPWKKHHQGGEAQRTWLIILNEPLHAEVYFIFHQGILKSVPEENVGGRHSPGL